MFIDLRCASLIAVLILKFLGDIFFFCEYVWKDSYDLVFNFLSNKLKMYVHFILKHV